MEPGRIIPEATDKKSGIVYRVDRSVGIHNEATGKIDLRKSLRVLGKFFLSEPRSKLKQLEVPGLLVFGEHEILYNPWQVSRRARKLMPSLESKVIEGAGHAAIYDKPEKANRVVIDYLND